jgi:hypothetical protein
VNISSAAALKNLAAEGETRLDPVGGVDPVGNNLLRALRLDDWNILQPRLEECSAGAGTVLHDPGDTVRFAWFPRGASLISYLVVLQDGRAIETALVGREGAVS